MVGAGINKFLMDVADLVETRKLSKECPASKVTVVGANRLPAAWKNSAGVPFPEMIRRILQRNQEFREKFNEPFDYEFVDA